MINYIEGKNAILSWLQQRYQEKNNKDFIFKASYIARDMKISNPQIGHMLCLLERDGIINRCEEGKKSANRRATQFNTSNRKSEIKVSIWSVIKKILRTWEIKKREEYHRLLSMFRSGVKVTV